MTYPTSPIADPTSVMGRRSAAWLLDFVLFFFLLFLVFSRLAVHDTFGNSCDALQNADVTNVCAEINGDAYFLDDSSDTNVMNLFTLFYFVGIYALLQGFTGASPGKFLLGLRVVDPQGNRCGPIKSLIRSLLWFVDGAPWIIPGLVGFVVGLTSTGHRRIGDMAAGTYVVATSSVGTPIQVGGAAGIPNFAPSGPQSAYGNAWAPNPAAPVTPPPVSSPPVTPPPGAPAWGPAQPPAPAPASPPAPAAPMPDPSANGPQWDAARNAYIQWDPDGPGWLAWNDASERWDPI